MQGSTQDARRERSVQSVRLSALAVALVTAVLATCAESSFAAAPSNDDFALATPLTGDSVDLLDQSNADASGQLGEPNHAGTSLRFDCSSATNPDSGCLSSVWYTWTAPRTADVVIDTCDPADATGIDTTLAVYTGAGVAELDNVASNDDAIDGDCAYSSSSRVSFRAFGGTIYRIAVAGYGGSTWTFPLHLSQAPRPPPPANDDFAAATTLAGGSDDLADQTTDNALGEPGEPDHAGVSLHEGCSAAVVPDRACLTSVWYTYSSPSDVLVTIDLCDPATTLDTTLGVYTGTAVSALSAVASNDDADHGCPGADESDAASRLTFRASAGATYGIAVAGLHGAGGGFVFHLRTAPAPPLPGPTPATPSSPPPAGAKPVDTVRPILGPLSLSRSVFRAARSGPSISARVGTKGSYRLSEIAIVKFGVERRLRGRRSHGKCVRPTRSNRRGKRCVRYVALRGSFTHRGETGQNEFILRGRLRGRSLRPGRYRLRAVAKDPAGNLSPIRRKRFRIVRR